MAQEGSAASCCTRRHAKQSENAAKKAKNRNQQETPLPQRTWEQITEGTSKEVCIHAVKRNG